MIDNFRILDLLTPRDQDVLSLMVLGMTNEEIADALGLKISSIRVRVFRVMEAFPVNGRVRVVLLCLRDEHINAKLQAIRRKLKEARP